MDLSYEQIQGVNISTLKHMKASPKHFKHAVETPSRDTSAKALGTATHCAILEPGRFAAEYAAEPDFGNCSFKANKAERDNWRALNEGKKLISFADEQRLIAMSKAVHAHPHAVELLKEGKAEQAIVWKDPDTGLTCKGRLDWLGKTSIVGLKTTRSNDFRSFRNGAEDYGYVLQWAWYHWGQKVRTGVSMNMFEICVESAAPYDVVVYRVPDSVLSAGLEEARDLLLRVKECQAAGSWPGRAQGIVEFERAPWAGVGAQDDMDTSGLEEMDL